MSEKENSIKGLVFKDVDVAEVSIEHKVESVNNENFLKVVDSEVIDMAVRMNIAKVEPKLIEQTKEQKIPKRVKKFMFSNEEINMFPMFYQNILSIKRDRFLGLQARDLMRGSERKAWKLLASIKLDRPSQYWIVRNFGQEGFKCKICNQYRTMGAIVHWKDQYKDDNGKLLETNFVIRHVCLSCLRDAGANNIMSYADFMSVLLNNMDKISLSELHNAKDHNCMFCNGLESDSTWVTLEYNGYILAAPACDKDLEILLRKSKRVVGMDTDVSEQDVAEFSPYLQHQIRSMRGVHNRLIKAHSMTENVLKVPSEKEALTDADFKLEDD